MRRLIDVVVEGALLTKNDDEAMDIMDNMASNSYQRLSRELLLLLTQILLLY